VNYLDGQVLIKWAPPHHRMHAPSSEEWSSENARLKNIRPCFRAIPKGLVLLSAPIRRNRRNWSASIVSVHPRTELGKWALVCHLG